MHMSDIIQLSSQLLNHYFMISKVTASLAGLRGLDSQQAQLKRLRGLFRIKSGLLCARIWVEPHLENSSGQGLL